MIKVLEQKLNGKRNRLSMIQHGNKVDADSTFLHERHPKFLAKYCHRLKRTCSAHTLFLFLILHRFWQAKSMRYGCRRLRQMHRAKRFIFYPYSNRHHCQCRLFYRSEKLSTQILTFWLSTARKFSHLFLMIFVGKSARLSAVACTVRYATERNGFEYVNGQ